MMSENVAEKDLRIWRIVDRSGFQLPTKLLPPRPHDAHPVNQGGPFTPWYREQNHLHIESGRIVSIHAFGTYAEVWSLLCNCLSNEAELLRNCNPDEDMNLQ